MINKKKILLVNEGSYATNTGFARIGKEVVTRLFNTGKYDILEIGNYVRTSDPRNMECPWPVIGSSPEPHDHEYHRVYHSNQTAQFGSEIFEKVCIDFNPDIVLTWTDQWFCDFIRTSPLRSNYKWVHMACVDSKPSKPAFGDTYADVDVLLHYTKFGESVIAEDFPQIKGQGIVRPGVNLDIFKPLDKDAIRHHFGLPKNANIVMTVMRNQRRKLFPDLMESFADFLQYCKDNNNQELLNNTYLYIHTSYPDVGFDIGRHILQNGIGHRILCTYTCQNCKRFFPVPFQTEITFCKYCGNLSCHMPNTQHGVSEQDLCVVYNMADCYVQYSICEGLGIPICEAKACGLPTFALDYSGTTEQVDIYGCYLIQVEKFFHESVIETEQVRALPNNKDFVRKLYNFLSLPQDEKKRMGAACIKDSENYSFERSAKIFENAIDSLEVPDHKDTWKNPNMQLLPENGKIDNGMTNGQLVDWCISNVIKKPKLINSFWRNSLVKGLNIGYLIDRGGRHPFNKDSLLSMLTGMNKKHNFWEYQRLNKLNYNEEKIKYEVI